MNRSQKIRRALAFALALVLVLSVTACGIPWEHIDALKTAKRVGGEFRAAYQPAILDVPYGDGRNDLQKLDIYLPGTEGPYPTIVFFHGGFWQSGHRSEYAVLAKTLIERGFAVVLVDYRLYPDATYPAFMDDAVNAMNWIFEHIDSYGGCTKRLVLAGHSAGAQIVTQLVTDDRFRGRLSFDVMKIRGVAPISGPFDFDAGKEKNRILVRKFLGSDEAYEEAQPENYVRGDVPPFLVLIGSEDDLTPADQAEAYAKAMREKGADAKFVAIAGGEHYSVMVDMIPGFEGPALDAFAGFAKERTKPLCEVGEPCGNCRKHEATPCDPAKCNPAPAAPCEGHAGQ